MSRLFGRIPPFRRRGVTPAQSNARFVNGQILHFMAQDPTTSTATVRFLAPGGDPGFVADNQRRFLRVPQDGRIWSMYVRARVAGGGSANTTYVLEVNSVDSLLTVPIAQSANPFQGNNTSTIIQVSAGDRISVEVVNEVGITSAPTDVSVSVLYAVNP